MRTFKEEVIKIFNEGVEKEEHVCKEKFGNYSCSVCNRTFCEVWCFFKHLFKHWRNGDQVTGWYDIKRYIK